MQNTSSFSTYTDRTIVKPKIKTFKKLFLVKFAHKPFISVSRKNIPIPQPFSQHSSKSHIYTDPYCSFQITVKLVPDQTLLQQSRQLE